MLKALIIDDEENSQASLKGKLELFCPEIEEIALAGNVADAVESVRANTPDVIFLDVNLAGESGFEVLERLKEEGLDTPEVVFTTAHDEYAIKAIKFSAIDYLLKPIDAEELVKAIRKIEAKKEMSPGTQLNVLLENFRQASDSPKKMVIPSSDGMHILRVSDIMRCESSSNYTQFFLNTGKVLLASKTLKEFDNMLTDYNFERIHKSHLVNMNYVKKYMQSDGGYLVMDDGSQIPVANRKKEQLLSMLKSM
ncbi:MAG: LytTR family DNA-binding domain-containing protein [Schleiferiaceae bacterium]|jgi:two-component system LytT family response regulator|nr:LytTR family DNA-binding domain-containing protein [Schleiferiaceae bacterium]